MAPRITTYNTVRIKVEFPDGAPPPKLARIALLDNKVHRVVNPRRQHVATFHGLPAGATQATITVEGRSVGRQKLVIPEKGEVEVTLRARGGVTDDGFAYHGGFHLVDEHSGEPLRGRKYRITSASGKRKLRKDMPVFTGSTAGGDIIAYKNHGNKGQRYVVPRKDFKGVRYLTHDGDYMAWAEGAKWCFFPADRIERPPLGKKASHWAYPFDRTRPPLPE